MNRLTLLAAVAVVVAADAWVLGGVAHNRSGAPDAQLKLTQSQLPLAGTSDDNSGVFVRLDLRPTDTRPPHPWLDEAKLKELGHKRGREGRVSQDPVFVAIEHDPGRPRLAIVDAAKDAAALRRRHPDAAHVLITPATLRVWRGRGVPADSRAFFVLETPRIHVPLPCSRILTQSPDSYTLTVDYGRSYEPWISGCRAGN